MRLFDYGPSQNCLKVRLLAAHLDLHLDIVPVAIFRGEGQTASFLAKNPIGSVPVLEIAPGHYLPESNAILVYLAEGSRYLPEGRVERAQVMRWLFFEHVYVQTSIALLRYWTLTGKLDRYAAAVPARRALGERVLKIVDSSLSDRPFITGGDYTIADMSLFAYCHVAGDAGFDLDCLPRLQEWCTRVRQQPGFLARRFPTPWIPRPPEGYPLRVKPSAALRLVLGGARRGQKRKMAAAGRCLTLWAYAALAAGLDWSSPEQ